MLVVDLDSQGHATKCLGYEGEDFEQTLLDVLVRKVPLAEVTIRDRRCRTSRSSRRTSR